MTGCLRLATNEDRWTEYKRLATTAQSFGMEMHLLSACRGQDDVAADGDVAISSARPGCRPTARPRPRTSRSRWPRVRACMARRSSKAHASTGFEIARWPGRGGGDQSGAHRLRDGGQLRRTMGAADRRHGRRVGAAAGGQAPVCHHREGRWPCVRCGDAARSRPPHLLQGRGGRARLRRLRARIPLPGRRATCRTISSSSSSKTTGITSNSTWSQALARVPALEKAGIKKMINGPESFTPDGNFILGAAPELRNFFVGAGFNAFGIASGGGAGWVLAEWAAKGEAPMDLWVVDIRRFSRPPQGPANGPATAPSRPMASTTPSASRMRNMRAAGRASSRRSMIA